MAVVALASVTGAPGVTTTVVALALAWPRPCLVVEADVTGGSAILAGYLHGSVPHDRGLVDLAMAQRRGSLAEGLHRASLPLGLSPHARLVPGLTTPAQVATMASLWEPLAVVLQGLERTGTDVLVDAGRLGAAGEPGPLLREADQVLVVTGTRLPGIPALPGRLRLLREELERIGTGEDTLGLLVVGENRPYSARELAKFTGVPSVATMAWDPPTAAAFSTGSPPPRRLRGVLPPAPLDRTSLGRSTRDAVATIQTRIQLRRHRLDPQAEPADQAAALEEGAGHG
jgi:hypothetical protein